MNRHLFAISWLFLSFIISYGTSPGDPVPSPGDITRDMIEQTKEIRTLSYRMRRLEQMKGQMNEQISSVKLSRKPLKVYSRQEYPKEGVEVLYIEGKNNGKALVNPNGFPWVNLKLDPHGKIMRKNQHHLIINSGFDHVISILEHMLAKYGEKSLDMMKLKGETTWDGQKCWILELNNPYFRFKQHTVGQNETLAAIAKINKINEYMILKNNDRIHHYDDVSQGQVITIPNDYCKRMIVFIDQQRKIPLLFKIYDNEGLYEQYEFTAVQLDPGIQHGEFTEDYDAYDF